MIGQTEAVGPKICRKGQPRALEKLALLRYYIGGKTHRGGGFVTATSRAPERYYLDLFAGPGECAMDDGSRIDGSPRIAALADPPFTRLSWADARPENAASLRAHAADFPHRRINVLCGDANSVIEEVLEGVPRSMPALAFLDPEGAELAWTTVARVAAHKPRNKVEQFILFPTNTGIVWLMPRDTSKMAHADRLGAMLPDPEAWRRL